MQRLFAEFGVRFGLGRLDENPRLQEILRAAAERGRRALSQAEATELRFVWNNESWQLPMTREEFEKLAEPLLARLRDPVLRALRDAGVKSASDE